MASEIRADAETRHAAVRMLVEAEHPTCRVTQIDEHTRTEYDAVNYPERADPPEMVLGRVTVAYTVTARPLERGDYGAICDVAVTADGRLAIMRTNFTAGARPV